jgi:predicted nuclease of predicted toxin-antitoxin system
MNISPVTVQALQAHGWDIIRVSSVLSHSAPDEEVLKWARAANRVLITQDLDFSRLLALRGCTRPSVINLRLLASDPDTITAKLLEQLPQIEPLLELGSVVTLDDRTARARRLPLTGGPPDNPRDEM